MNECILCDEKFEFDHQLNEHYKWHQSQESVPEVNHIPDRAVNRISKIKFFSKDSELNVEAIFSIDEFSNTIDAKIDSIKDISDNIDKRDFAEKIKIMVIKYPFVDIKDLLNEWLNGKGQSRIINKYNLTGNSISNIIDKIFGFNGKRHSVKSDTFNVNMNISGWQKNYDNIISNYEFFKNEIQTQMIRNTIRCYVILLLITSESKWKNEDVKQTILKDISDMRNLFPFLNDETLNQFLNMKYETKIKFVDEIFDDLHIHELIHLTENESWTEKNINDIKQSMIFYIKSNKGQITGGNLKELIKNEFQILELVHDKFVFDNILNELEKEGKIGWRKEGSEFGTLFIPEERSRYFKEIEKIDTQELPFRGRKIDPDTFVEELLQVDKGGMDDDDDQVTRIAGLVLAESLTIAPPKNKEKPELFDFSIDLKNYNFSPEQEDAMKKLDFDPKSPLMIMNCKVELDEKLTLRKYELLKKVIPPGQNGVIITFIKPEIKVLAAIQKDKKLQIVDKEGVKIWASITKKIPARKNSLCKIYFDPVSKLENTVCKVNSLDYEDGSAVVTTIPDGNEVFVTMRSLEEISLNEGHPSEFSDMASNYYEFLIFTSTLSSKNKFIDGLFNLKPTPTKINIEGFNEFSWDEYRTKIDFSEDEFYDRIDCDCPHWTHESYELCPHMICALNYLFCTFTSPNKAWNLPILRTLNQFLGKRISDLLFQLGITNNSLKEDIELRKIFRDFSTNLRTSQVNI